MREGKKHPFAINVWRWGLLILLLVLWEIGARLKWIDPFFFSSPLEIARTAERTAETRARARAGHLVRHRFPVKGDSGIPDDRRRRGHVRIQRRPHG